MEDVGADQKSVSRLCVIPTFVHGNGGAQRRCHVPGDPMVPMMFTANSSCPDQALGQKASG
jgi:hypothetical protein